MCNEHRAIGVSGHQRSAAPRRREPSTTLELPSRQTTLELPQAETEYSPPKPPTLPPSRQAHALPAPTTSTSATTPTPSVRPSTPPPTKPTPPFAKPPQQHTSSPQPTLPPRPPTPTTRLQPAGAPSPTRTLGSTPPPITRTQVSATEVLAIINTAYFERKTLPKQGAHGDFSPGQKKNFEKALLQKLYQKFFPDQSIEGKDHLFEGNNKGTIIYKLVPLLKSLGLQQSQIPSFMGGQKMS